MKRLSTFLCTLALLFGVVGVANAQDPGKKVYEKDWTSAGSYDMWNQGFTTGTPPEAVEGKSIGIVSSALQVVNGAAVNNWELQYFVGDGCPVKKGANYVVRIGIKGSEAGSLTCVLGGWGSDNKNTSLAFTAAASDVEVTIKDMPTTVANAHVMLQSGAFVGTITITKVQVFELESVDTYGDAIATSDYTNGATVGWKSDSAPDPTYDGTNGLTITNGTKINYWDLQYSVVGGSVDVSKEYIMRITAKATSAATIHCNFANARDGIFGVTTDWSTAEVLFGTPDATAWRGVNIQTGDYVGTINVKNASLHPVVEGRLVEVGDAGYSTFSANKAVKMRGVTAYGAKYDGSKIVLTPVTEIPANTGVIIEAAKDTYKVPVIESAASIASVNDLQVSDGSIVGNSSTIYALGKKGDKVGFMRVKTDVTIPSGKAYLVIPPTAGARDFIGFADDDVTGVNVVKGQMEDERSEYFNLAGQRVAQPTKGLYIVNGKKVILK
jgi:hypothetical protein